MTNRLELNWKVDGFIDEQRYYCSETLIDTENLPVPKAVLAGDVRAYTDTSIEPDTTYYIAVGSVKSGIEKISAQVTVVTSSTPWFSTSVVLNQIQNAATLYHNYTGVASLSNMGADLTGQDKFYGAVLATTGKIYCVPFDGQNILIIDPVAGTATGSNMGATLSGSAKWYGGVLASNGKIYCMPGYATDILVIDKNSIVPSLPIKVCLSPHLNKF